MGPIVARTSREASRHCPLTFGGFPAIGGLPRVGLAGQTRVLCRKSPCPRTLPRHSNQQVVPSRRTANPVHFAGTNFLTLPPRLPQTHRAIGPSLIPHELFDTVNRRNENARGEFLGAGMAMPLPAT